MTVTNKINGFLLVDKPEGISSSGVVGRVRKLLNVRKAGHCGTLDPIATGLLIICLGKATKLSRFVLGSRKSYQATIRLGGTSTTYDREGEIEQCESPTVPTQDEVEAALEKFCGRIRQTPPIYSAVKVKGRPLYKYAREAKEVVVESREILIEHITLDHYTYPIVQLSITCGAGTYIRSLAHDLGRALECGGYVEDLRRSGIAEWSVERAVTLEDVSRVSDSTTDSNEIEASLGNSFIGVDEMISLPALTVNPNKVHQVENGVPLMAEDFTHVDSTFAANQLVALRADSGDLLAIGKALYPAQELLAHPDSQVIEYVRVI